MCTGRILLGASSCVSQPPLRVRKLLPDLCRMELLGALLSLRKAHVFEVPAFHLLLQVCVLRGVCFLVVESVESKRKVEV